MTFLSFKVTLVAGPGEGGGGERVRSRPGTGSDKTQLRWGRPRAAPLATRLLKELSLFRPPGGPGETSPIVAVTISHLLCARRQASSCHLYPPTNPNIASIHTGGKTEAQRVLVTYLRLA